jgi:hypothetical protein
VRGYRTASRRVDLPIAPAHVVAQRAPLLRECLIERVVIDLAALEPRSLFEVSWIGGVLARMARKQCWLPSEYLKILAHIRLGMIESILGGFVPRFEPR